NLFSSTYATTAWISDGTLSLTYAPVATTLTVSLTNFAGTVTARWYDPSNGAFVAIGSYGNTGSQTFMTPGANQDGDTDWVLVLEASSTPTAPPTGLTAVVH